MTAGRALLLLIVLLLPIDGTDFLRVPVGPVRLSVVDLLLVALLYADFLGSTVRGFAAPSFARVCLWIGLLASGLSAVSLLYLSDVSYDVKVTLAIVELVALVYVTSRTVTDRAALAQVLGVVALAAMTVALATILKSLGVDVPGEVRKARLRFGPFQLGVGGISGLGVTFSMVLVAGLPVALVPGILGRWARFVLALSIAAAAAISLARGAWLALGIQVLARLYFRARQESRVGLRTFFGLSFAATLVAMVFLGPSLYEQMRGLRPQTVSSRLAGFGRSFDLALADPLAALFGAGKGRFMAGLGVAPHNLFLDLLVSKGLLTLAAFVVLLVRITAALVPVALPATRSREADPLRPLAEIVLLMLVGVLSAGLFAPITTSFTLALVAALAVSVVSMAETGRAATPPWPNPAALSRPHDGGPGSLRG